MLFNSIDVATLVRLLSYIFLDQSMTFRPFIIYYFTKAHGIPSFLIPLSKLKTPRPQSV